MLRETLEGNGCTVLSARGGTEALQIANAHAGPIHVIVTDLIMPGMSGRSTAEQIALARPETKILYISGYSGEAVFRQGLLSRESALLEKPFTPDDLLRRLRELLDVPDA